MDEAARIIRHNGMKVTGYCRGGLFPAGRRGRPAGADRRQQAHDRRGRGDRRRLPGHDRRRSCRPARATSRRRAARYLDGMAAILPHARAAKVPLAVEPLHPMYAADRGCISLLSEALDVCDAARRRHRRRGRCLSPVVGPEPRARRSRAPGPHPRASHLRLAGADQGHPARPRHDGRRRDRPAGASAAWSRPRASTAIRRWRSSPPRTGGSGRATR